MYECDIIWRRPFRFLCVALRATTSATVVEWDVSAIAGDVLCKVLICGVMAVCVCRKNCLFCVLMPVRDGERLGV